MLAVVAVTVVGAFCAHGSIVVNFDDVTTPLNFNPGLGGGNFNYGVLPSSYAGLTWVGTWGVGENATFKTAYFNSFSGNGANFAYNEGASLMLAVTDGRFNFDSAMFAAWGSHDQAWPYALGITATYITAQGYLNGVAAGAPVTVTLSTTGYKALNANIVGIDKVQLTSDGWWVMDDFAYTAAVPEPTTVIAGALLLLPFGASTLRMLRKSRTT